MACILIVDDDFDVRAVLADLLRFDGHAVTAAAHGAEALALLEAATVLPDVIILDVTMPVMDGYEFLARKSAAPRIAAIPVIVATATYGAERTAMPGVDFLPKPVDLEQLSHLIALRTQGRGSGQRDAG